MLAAESFGWEESGRAQMTRFDVIGNGEDALLLPALSSVSSRVEMHPLASLLADRYRCVIPDWPGFGAETGPNRPLSPEDLAAFLRAFLARGVKRPAVVIAAGHSAAYVMSVAREQPDAFSRIVLVAPTWRGPLPTAMGDTRRPLWRGVWRLIEAPVVGQPFYRLNVNRLVVGRMLKAHVYADPQFVTPKRLTDKSRITRRPAARLATAAFVTGGLDLVTDERDYLGLFAPPLPARVLALICASTPRKSRAHMDALTAILARRAFARRIITARSGTIFRPADQLVYRDEVRTYRATRRRSAKASLYRLVGACRPY
jgi:pimeloyl-ACP methyl ester carboxylesterase